MPFVLWIIFHPLVKPIDLLLVFRRKQHGTTKDGDTQTSISVPFTSLDSSIVPFSVFYRWEALDGIPIVPGPQGRNLVARAAYTRGRFFHQLSMLRRNEYWTRNGGWRLLRMGSRQRSFVGAYCNVHADLTASSPPFRNFRLNALFPKCCTSDLCSKWWIAMIAYVSNFDPVVGCRVHYSIWRVVRRMQIADIVVLGLSRSNSSSRGNGLLE